MRRQKLRLDSRVTRAYHPRMGNHRPRPRSSSTGFTISVSVEEREKVRAAARREAERLGVPVSMGAWIRRVCLAEAARLAKEGA